MKTIILLLLFAPFIVLKAQPENFDPKAQPASPDYSLQTSWAALPFRNDAADIVPSTEKWVNDSLKQADVFFIYPTVYLKGKTWCADVEDKKLNAKIDGKPIKYQASVFNESCRVYAPRYRQACLKTFYDNGQREDALDFAYDDVKRAFKYYMEHYNNGRPFIIASHSQGTLHARRLLREMIDGTDLQKRMICAYVVGFGITDTLYKKIKPCTNGNETGCYVTWASFKTGVEPANSPLYGNVCVNPVTWNSDTVTVDASRSLGALLLKFDKKYSNVCTTKVHHHFLWVTVDLPFIRRFKVLHVGDYNLFWFDIRKNVKDRVSAFLAKH